MTWRKDSALQDVYIVPADTTVLPFLRNKVIINLSSSAPSLNFHGCLGLKFWLARFTQIGNSWSWYCTGMLVLVFNAEKTSNFTLIYINSCYHPNTRRVKYNSSLQYVLLVKFYFSNFNLYKLFRYVICHLNSYQSKYILYMIFIYYTSFLIMW